MTILVVDDDVHMVRSILKNVVWCELGIDKVYTANSVHQAKGILEGNGVDLLLCDIEMPQESGLDLLEWVRGNDMDIEAIFLTSYASFDYAQRAVSLNSIEYYLKPVDYQELTKGLKRALKKVHENQRTRLAIEQSDHWNNSQHEVLAYFWAKVASGHYGDDGAALQHAITLGRLPYNEDSRIIPVMIRPLNRGGDLSALNPNELERTLREMAVEWFDHGHSITSVLTPLSGEWILLLEEQCAQRGEAEMDELLDAFLRRVCAHFGISVFCGLSDALPVDKVYGTLLKLREMLDDNVCLADRCLRLSSYKRQDIPYDAQRVNALRTDLDGDDLYSFSRAAQQYLDELKTQHVNARILKLFRLDVTQMVYAFLRKTRISAHERFSDGENGRYYQNAIESIDDMKAYVRYLTSAAELTPQREKSVVNQLLDYIDQNYQGEINRSDLSRLVYLNPDYIARIFKKEVGMSISSYILAKRMAKAKTMLRASSTPIHEVSARVGYDSFAYFSKLFKKKEGMSPSEYRRKVKREQL